MEKIEERIAGYQEFKQALDQELQQAAEGFVKIGFLLRLAMETNILKESGYRDVYEFAEQEYNLDKSQVSRFIHINMKFSEDGHSDRLQDQYRGYGYAKLAVMLQLPDAVLEELSPAFSKSEIQKIHEEIKEEKKTSDIEVWLEGAQGQQEGKRQQEREEDSLQKVIRQLCHNELEIYRAFHEAYEREEEEKIIIRDFQEILAPAGEAIYSVRIPGEGRLMLSVKGVEQPVSIVRVRTNEKEAFSWKDLVEGFDFLFLSMPWEESWETVFQEPLPEKEKEKGKIAPVQMPEETKPAAKKKPKVQAVKETPKPEPIPGREPAPGPEKGEEEEKPKRQEENGTKETGYQQDPIEERQTSIETDFKEILPEGYELSQVQTETETEHWEAITSGIHQFQRELAWPEAERDPKELLKNGKEILNELERIIRIREGKEG